MSKFSSRLRLLRIEKKLRQEDLALKMDISKSAIGMYERGEREPSLDLLKQFASFFEVSVDYLTGVSDERRKAEEIKYDVQGSTPNLNRILKETVPTWGGIPLTNEQKEVFIDFLESYLARKRKEIKESKNKQEDKSSEK